MEAAPARNYLVFALAAAHTIGYQLTEKQRTPFVVVAAACILVAASLQTGWILQAQSSLGGSS